MISNQSQNVDAKVISVIDVIPHSVAEQLLCDAGMAVEGRGARNTDDLRSIVKQAYIDAKIAGSTIVMDYFDQE